MAAQLTKAHGSFAETRVDEDVVLMSVDTGNFFGLKGTGLAIWELLDGERSEVEIVNELASRYDVDNARCAADVREFLDELQQAGFVSSR